jgi:hypothetical protein
MHRPIEAYRQVASLRLKSGRTVRAEVARGDGGTLCYQVIWGPSAGGCGRIPRNALPSMMVSGSGAQQLVLLHGAVGQAIETVELVHDDGEVERLRIQNGYVLKQIDPDGPSPARIVGRDPQGKVVADRSAWGPG